jgi:hypothetical protein
VAKYTMTDGYILINGTAFSDHANNVALDDKADQIDFTTFSPNAYKQYGQGMKDATITCTFFSDFAAASVHYTLQPLYASGGTTTIEVRPTSAARSATNPAAVMTARLYSYTGIAGKVGDAATFDATFQNAGTTGLVWATV